ncbi:putative motility protein [Kurthia massiliensis]|uniref:putative motility protein n=1 Tax=Kurthia massiliensis TaxID=1033739 RepID=UPI00028A1732|nr:putative motility protein [Kurthia massiliensis]
MDINAIMSSQLLELQQTVQMSVMQQAMNMETTAVTHLMEQMPQPQPQSLDPNVGQRIDISI